MVKQTVIWTALPHGRVDAQRARVSVYVSPRLTGEKALAHFGAFRHWTSTVAQATFEVCFEGYQPVAATRVGPALRPDLWELLVTDDTFVRDHQTASYNGVTLNSFPAANVANHLLDQLVSVATTSPTEYPPIDDLMAPGRFRPLHLDEDDRKRLDAKIKSLLDGRKAIPAGAPDPELDYYRLRQFYTPVGASVEPRVPEFDFHQLWSSLGEHPALERLLGIVVDLEFTLPEGLASPAIVWVKPTWPADSTDILTKVSCTLGSSSFAATPRSSNPDVTRGRLRLGDPEPGLNRPRYEVLSVDEAGAALRLGNLADALARMTSPRYAANTPDESSVPAIRSSAMAIVRADRAEASAAKFARDTTLNNQLTTLYAEDLVRGYRLDVGVAGRWYSMHECVSTFDFRGGAHTEQLADEGWISTSFTQAADGSKPDEAKLSETIARWQGYSLSATKPGEGVLADESGTGPSRNRSGSAFQLEITRRTKPGTLVPLRFGREYRFRMRTVDWAGNSVPQSDTDLTHTLTARYGRFEPVPAPTCLKAAPVSEGASAEHLVIRGDDTASDERWLVPPKIAASDAELMSLLDKPNGLDPATHAMLVARADGALDGIPDRFDSGKPYYPVLSFPVEHDGVAPLPYLVHPWARGVAFRDLPGFPGWSTYDFGELDWPATRPIKLVLVDGPFKTTWQDGVLTISLPQAERLRLRYSSYVEPGSDLDKMALWQEILRRGGLSDPEITELKTLAGKGAVWMLTPYRELDLVHAVRRPLPKLAFDNPAAGRAVGETFATFHEKTVYVDRRSSAQVDLLAKWTDPIDPLDRPGPVDVDHNEVAFRTPLDVIAPLDRVEEFTGRHEFKDTKYHRVTYRLSAMTRFAEYFVVRRSLTWHGEDTLNLDTGELVPDWDKLVRLSDSGAVIAHYARDRDYEIDNASGTITRKPSIPTEVQLDFRCLPAPITRESETVTLDVRSSARPSSPKVSYVIPAFSWSGASSQGQVTSNRGGNYLRVYLERPWWSSGAGELLGVVLWPLASPPPERVKPFVTQWGVDPIWKTAPVSSSLPVVTDFALRTAVGSVQLDETVDMVTVVGHEVSYDATRRLWYCDIQLDPGRAYMPFVRLALARYQPQSLPGVHLSRVVLAEFAQLAPDRFATLTFPTSSSVSVQVTGVSYSQRRTGRNTRVDGTTEIEVDVEERTPGVTDPHLWWQPTRIRRTLTATQTRDGVRWEGLVPLLGPRGSQPMRLVIREYERFVAETGTPPRRLVYVDTIEL